MTSSTARANHARRRTSVVIGTPSLHGDFCGSYVGSLMATVVALAQAGIGVDWAYLPGCPVLSSARAELAARFLKSASTHLLFVDADHGWSPNDVLRLLSHDASFVAATYARWQGGDFDIAGDLQMDPNRPGVARIGGAVGLGFALLTRGLFEQMARSYPERRMREPGREGRSLYNFFPITVENGEAFDEDYNFCNLWHTIGGEILVDLNIRISHWKSTDIAGPVPIDALQAEMARRAAAA